MKEFMNAMEKDYREEGFTVKEWIIAQALVVGFIGVLFAADYLGRLMMSL